jgi:hypothetical protein
MFKIAKIASGFAAAVIVPATYAAVAPVPTIVAPVPLTNLTAPDAVSRAILAHPILKFEQGAVSNADIPAAIHRNYPMIVEQNLARMDAKHTATFVDQLSDVELKGMAQLYTNANADAHRTGTLLLVAANRMDGPHLARMSKFFGYTPVYNAILAAAPIKAQSFAQNATIAFEAPIPGAETPMAAVARSLTLSSNGAAASAEVIQLPGGGKITPMQWKPSTGMTWDEIYTGFRGMQVGELAGTAALYETAFYAGTQLTVAWGSGYAFGTGLTYLADTYTSTWYNETFVPMVGNTYTWFQNTVDMAGTWAGSNLYDLGHFEMTTAPTFSLPPAAEKISGTTGGDFDVSGAWASDDDDDNGCALTGTNANVSGQCVEF